MIDLSEFAPNRPAMLLHGDIRTIGPLLPAGSVAMIATSPPYYNLRDYRNGDAGIGNEATPEAYIASLVDVFAGLRNALRDDGTLWLNLGDSYSGSGKGGGGSFGANGSTKAKGTRRMDPESDTLGAKQLMGMPWRAALALQAAGWYLRADLIWSKPNAMPESTKDRPSKCHEYVFLLSKSPDYFYDWFAVRQSGSVEGSRNLRSIWTISTESYKGAHFATWPLALAEPMILAGSSAYGYCSACGNPYTRNIEATRRATRPGRNTKVGSQAESLDIGNRDPQRHVTDYVDKGFIASCRCAFPPNPGIVLDPFLFSVDNGDSRAVNEIAKKFVDLDRMLPCE